MKSSILISNESEKFDSLCALKQLCFQLFSSIQQEFGWK